MRFLIVFRGIHNDFRVGELHAVVARQRGCSERECAADLRLEPTLASVCSSSEVSRDVAGVVLHGHVFCFAELRSTAEAREVCERCVLVRAVLVPLGHGCDYDECVASVSSPETRLACADMFCEKQPRSFKCAVESFGRKHTMVQQIERMERFGPALFDQFTGAVQLKDPDDEFWILEDAFSIFGHKMGVAHSGPRQILLGRHVASGAAHLGHKFHLSRRTMLGPTSTNAELSFVMANMARVKPGSLVLDPFCGTGSTLVSCTEMGAVAIGADLDMAVLRGRGGGRAAAMDVNFAQYHLPRPVGVVRADVLRSTFRAGPWLDAIVCDPPYGVREGAKSIRDDVDMPRSESFIPGTERVRFVDMLSGLLTFAADRLVPGGRLVFWLPTTPDYSDDDLPLNSALRLVSNCDQPMTTRMHRRLITMVRLSLPEQEAERELVASAAAARNPAHVCAHDDFSAKMMRQPARSEARLKAKSHSVVL
jgi:tRNA (guanine10-N2)-methyltransferase